MPKVNWSYVEPTFRAELVADQLREGYWLECPDVNKNNKPDLVGYGLAMGEIYWYKNPEWTRYLLANKVKEPVGMDYADISGNGFPDVIICHQLYGPKGTIIDPDPEGGKIDWLENPGNPENENPDHKWKRRYIGKTVGMHRLRVGYFTQKERLEVLGLPIVTAEGTHNVLPIVLFTQPDDVANAKEWPCTTIDYSSFRFIHGAEKKTGLIPGSSLDSVMLASDEGVTWLYYDESKQWQKVSLGTGELTQWRQTGFKGSGNVDVGRIGNDPFAYAVAVEPFHGNTISAYYKEEPGVAAAEAKWKRVILDVYGDPNSKGEGVGHHVVCRDFDGDGNDEILVALRGPYPWQGVFYYKAVDIKNGVFAKWRISDESAARIAVADFNGNGKLDFATIGYSVKHYYETEEPKVMVYYNDMPVVGLDKVEDD